MDYRIDAMIAGAEKAGTTSLGAYLATHPDIVSPFSAGGRTPEVEFPGFVTNDYSEPGRFRQLFETEFPRQPRTGEIALAKSVDILHSSDVARRLYEHNPTCKLIVSLRNPVDRAYSSFWHQRYRGAESAETFEMAIELERQRRESGITAPDRAYMAKGVYVEHLERLARLFGREQLFVLLLEDLQSSPGVVLGEIYAFLGVRDYPPMDEELHPRNRGRRTRWPRVAEYLYRDTRIKRLARSVLPLGARQLLIHRLRRLLSLEGKPPPMNAGTRAELNACFAPHNRRLEGFLGRELQSWHVGRDGKPRGVDAK